MEQPEEVDCVLLEEGCWADVKGDENRWLSHWAVVVGWSDTQDGCWWPSNWKGVGRDKGWYSAVWLSVAALGAVSAKFCHSSGVLT